MSKFISHFIAALAAISSVATLITFVFGWQVKDDTCMIKPILVAISIILICIFYAIYQTRRKHKIQLDLNASLKLTIQQADLFEQNGIIVIGVNEYFDSHVGDGIVSDRTLHGMFINRYYKDHIDDLDKDIQNSLNQQGVKPIETGCIRRHSAGKTNKYEIGTCALVYDGGKKYILVALTHFDNNDKAYMTRPELNHVLGKLMEFVSSMAEASEVHMPILGTGLARINRTSTRILHHIIDTLDFLYDYPIIGGLYIDIKSLNSAGINLNKIEDHFKNGIKE